MTVSGDQMKPARSFAHIDTWVFDLDNTLYPHHVNLWQQVDARIGEYIGSFLKVPPQEARRSRRTTTAATAPACAA